MKTITIALTFIFISLNANAIDIIVPKGQYQYDSAEIAFVRDVQLFSIADDVGKQRYEKLKTKKYICRFYPGDMVSCYRFIDNNDTIEISEQEVLQVAPYFGHKTRVELESRNEYELVYSVFQPVDMPIGVAEGYRLHVREEGDYFLEVFLDGNILRYRYANKKTLRLQLKKRKTIGDNHWLEYAINSIYKKVQ